MNCYVIYKGTGGLTHMLIGLVFCMEYCIKYNNKLIIDVISHSCYKHYLKDFFIIQDKECPTLIYSEDYSIIEPNIFFARNISIDYIKNYPNVEKLIDAEKYIYEYKIDKYNIRYSLQRTNTRQRVKIYAGPGNGNYSAVIKYIRLKPEILNIIKQQPLIDNFIGIHFRNTDLNNNIKEFINQIKTNNKKYTNIYLATDDSKAYDIFKIELPNYTIYQYTKPIESNGEPIHYAEKNKYNLILNALIDMYFLYKSNDFFYSKGSSFSRFILRMRNEKKSIFDE